MVSAAEKPPHEGSPYDIDSRRAAALYVARRYYVDNVTMSSVGRELAASRSTVSRLLRYARENGLVEIRFMPDKQPLGNLRQALELKYGITAHVAPVSNELSDVECLLGTASYGARVIWSAIESDMVIAVSWGTMMGEVSKRLIEKSVTNTQLVQLNGFGFPTGTGPHYSASVMTYFSQAFGSSVQDFPVPIFFDDRKTRDMLFEERTISRIRRLQYNSDVAVFNVGTVRSGGPDQPYSTGYFIDDADVRSLQRDGAVGEIAGTYFDSNGEFEEVELNKRTSGPDLKLLQDVSKRICVTSGAYKIQALSAALVGGYVTDLVVDEGTARGLLLEGEQLREDHSGAKRPLS